MNSRREKRRNIVGEKKGGLELCFVGLVETIVSDVNLFTNFKVVLL